jgi:hypothetical protein
MSSEVMTQVSWDPDENFEGCYDSGALYYSATGDLPECSSELRFAKNLNACAAGDDRLRLVGRYKNLFPQLERRTRALGSPGPDGQRWPGGMRGGQRRRRQSIRQRTVCGRRPGWDPGQQRTAASRPGRRPRTSTVFDGNWLNWNSNPPTVVRTRLEVVQEVTNSIIESLENVNVGVMRFNSNEGGPVIHALESVETSPRKRAANRQ